ncbi:hypothetical protein LBMAG42_22050 [Deltaproteobacteria bacterium]|nr:hypothetical protein LBMAG42_22050 [Deltaproteobacteria bacterium]
MDTLPLRARIVVLQDQLRARNRREGAAAIVVAAVCVGLLMQLSPERTIQAGLAVCAVSAIAIIATLARFGSAPNLDLSQSDEALSAAARAAVASQVQLLRWAPVWYVAPLAFGSSLVLWGLQNALATPLPWPIVALYAAIFIGIAALNIHAARALERSWA